MFGLGNALVDTVVSVDEAFLEANKITKGVMTLVDAKSQKRLLNNLETKKKELRSGGSAANTMVALAHCGGTGIYTGKVSADINGIFYKDDMIRTGIHFEVEPAKTGDTGTCVVLITPDAERTMLTHLGISTGLSGIDIDPEKIKFSQIAYIEGYLWDGDGTKEASIRTMEYAKQFKKKIAYTYSDPFCVSRSRDEFLKLTKEYFDIVFCNFEEAKAMSEKENPEDAVRFLGELCSTVFMTHGKEGAYYFHEGEIKKVEGFPVKAIDTVGAGDCFAAGALYGLTHHLNLEKCCRLGNYLASKVVQVVGPRLDEPIKENIKKIVG